MNNNQAKINKAKFELKNGTTQSNKEKEFASQLNNIDNKVNNNVNINVINNYNDNEMLIDDNISLNQVSENTKNSYKDSNSVFDETDNTNDEFKLFSKRILCELIKSESDECEIKEITDIANKLNPLLDIILNKSNAKINHMQNFITYFVELNSELVKTMPEYKNLKDDITFRFIISAKNIYNFTFEVYFSLYDLYNVKNII